MRLGSCFRFDPVEVHRKRIRFSFDIEALEGRALLSTATAIFQVPPGVGPAAQASASTPALFARMVGSLQAQIEIQAPRDDAPQHLTDTVNQLVSQFEADSTRLFAASRPWLNQLLQLQGEATRSAINSYKVQLDTGLIPKTSYFNEDVFLVIQEMTLSRKVWPKGTPIQEFLVLSYEAKQGLDALVQNLSTPGPGQLSAAVADAVVHAESYAFQTDVLLGATRKPTDHQNGQPGRRRSLPVLMRRLGAAISLRRFGQPNSPSTRHLSTRAGCSGRTGHSGDSSSSHRRSRILWRTSRTSRPSRTCSIARSRRRPRKSSTGASACRPTSAGGSYQASSSRHPSRQFAARPWTRAGITPTPPSSLPT